MTHRALRIGSVLVAPALLLFAGCGEEEEYQVGEFGEERVEDTQADLYGREDVYEDVEVAEQPEAEPAELAQADTQVAPEQPEQPEQPVEREQVETQELAEVSMPGIAMQLEGPEQVRVGEQFPLELTIKNTSKHPIHDVKLIQRTDGPVVLQQQEGQQQQGMTQEPGMQRGDAGSVPAGAQREQQGQQPQGQQQEGQQQQQGFETQGAQRELATFDELKPGEEKKIQLLGYARSEGEIGACISVDYNPTVCATITAAKPELAVERLIVDADKNPIEQVYACDEFYVLYRVRNTGDVATRPVTITERLPQGLTAEGSQEINHEIAAIEPGETEEWMTRLETERSGRFVGYAVAKNEALQARTNESGVLIMRPALELDVRGPRQAYLGRPITYQVAVRNTSEFPARDVNVAFALPEGAERMQISDQELDYSDGRFEIGELGANEERTFQFAFDLEEPGQIQARVVAEAYCAEAAQREIQTEVRGISAVLIEMVDETDPVNVGDTTTYVISVKNQGNTEDLNIRLQGQLPSELEFIESTGETDVQVQGQQILFGQLPSLGAGETKTWEVTVRANQAGRVQTKLELTSDANPEPVREEEPTTIVGAPGQGEAFPEEGQ